MRRKVKTRSIVIASVMLWLCAIGMGMWMIENYQNTQGAVGVAPTKWPADSPIKRLPGRATLVILAHPHCPCTRASIGELALLMTQCQGRVATFVLFFKPEGFPEGWERTDLWDSAASIPGVTVLGDQGGVEAARFNGVTSGVAMLYDVDGRLLFSGGITESRGHSGDNEGRSAIASLLTGEGTGQSETPVFGCSLLDEDNSCTEGAKVCSR
jgi:hypothetical protein